MNYVVIWNVENIKQFSWQVTSYQNVEALSCFLPTFYLDWLAFVFSVANYYVFQSFDTVQCMLMGGMWVRWIWAWRCCVIKRITGFDTTTNMWKITALNFLSENREKERENGKRRNGTERTEKSSPTFFSLYFSFPPNQRTIFSVLMDFCHVNTKLCFIFTFRLLFFSGN